MEIPTGQLLANIEEDINELKKTSLTNLIAIKQLNKDIVTRAMLSQMENKILRGLIISVFSIITTIVIGKI